MEEKIYILSYLVTYFYRFSFSFGNKNLNTYIHINTNSTNTRKEEFPFKSVKGLKYKNYISPTQMEQTYVTNFIYVMS